MIEYLTCKDVCGVAGNKLEWKKPWHWSWKRQQTSCGTEDPMTRDTCWSENQQQFLQEHFLHKCWTHENQRFVSRQIQEQTGVGDWKKWELESFQDCMQQQYQYYRKHSHACQFSICILDSDLKVISIKYSLCQNSRFSLASAITGDYHYGASSRTA